MITIIDNYKITIIDDVILEKKYYILKYFFTLFFCIRGECHI